MRSMCVGVAETGGWSMYLLFWLLTELKLLFFTQSNFPFIALFTDEKRGKSHIRGVPPVSATPTNALRALANSPLFANSPPCLGDANQRTACIG